MATLADRSAASMQHGMNCCYPLQVTSPGGQGGSKRSSSFSHVIIASCWIGLVQGPHRRNALPLHIEVKSARWGSSKQASHFAGVPPAQYCSLGSSLRSLQDTAPQGRSARLTWMLPSHLTLECHGARDCVRGVLLRQDAVKHTAEGLMEATTSRAVLTHAKGVARPGSSGLKGRRAQACEAACLARLLFAHLYPRLEAEGMVRPLVETEMPLVRVLAAMEGLGVAFDRRVLKQVKVGGLSFRPCLSLLYSLCVSLLLSMSWLLLLFSLWQWHMDMQEQRNLFTERGVLKLGY